MKDWEKTLISPDMPILEALRIIDSGAMQIVLVVDENRKLLGTVTDGDIRRGILRGISLDTPVKEVMNQKPTTVYYYETRDKILAMMKNKAIHQIPVIDDAGRVVHIEVLNKLLQSARRNNWVVIMAGGLGQRLKPLTDDCPKPMLKVGDKPILETIIQNFIEYGFYQFYIAVNYKAEMIETYFGDGSKWGVNIAYLREKERLGTVGALKLLPAEPVEPVIVMNGDLMTKVNFGYLLDFHHQHHSQATMCVREYQVQVPYGVVQIDNYRLTGIVEKPVQNYFVSAGVYVLDPQTFQYIPSNQYFDMPSLFDKVIRDRRETAVFPVREYWVDIGRMGDFEKANREYVEVFR